MRPEAKEAPNAVVGLKRSLVGFSLVLLGISVWAVGLKVWSPDPLPADLNGAAFLLAAGGALFALYLLRPRLAAVRPLILRPLVGLIGVSVVSLSLVDYGRLGSMSAAVAGVFVVAVLAALWRSRR